MLDELVRERDEARAEVARLRTAIAKMVVIARPRVDAPSVDVPSKEEDPDLADLPCYGIIALGCERARQEAAAEAH